MKGASKMKYKAFFIILKEGNEANEANFCGR